MTQSHDITPGPASIAWRRGWRAPVCAAVTLRVDVLGGGAWEAQTEEGAELAVICVSREGMNGALCARGEWLERVLATRTLGLDAVCDSFSSSSQTYRLFIKEYPPLQQSRAL